MTHRVEELGCCILGYVHCIPGQDCTRGLGCTLGWGRAGASARASKGRGLARSLFAGLVGDAGIPAVARIAVEDTAAAGVAVKALADTAQVPAR